MDMKSIMSNVASMPKVQEFLKGVNFPASKQDITNKAQQSGADNMIMSILQKLPDKVFQSKDDLMNEVSKVAK
jgi:hypothetical protein